MWCWVSCSLKYISDCFEKRYNELVAEGDGFVCVGDMVFMYKTMPDGCIKYMFEVIKTNFSVRDALNQKPFWKDMVKFNNGNGVYARLKLVEVLDEKMLTINELRKHGINGNIQSKRSCPAETLAFVMDSIK